MIAYLYTRNTSSVIAAMMSAARADGVAVFLGAAVRLVKPQLASHPRAGTALGVGTFIVAWMLPISPFAVLLIAGAVGAIVLRPTE